MAGGSKRKRSNGGNGAGSKRRKTGLRRRRRPSLRARARQLVGPIPTPSRGSKSGPFARSKMVKMTYAHNIRMESVVPGLGVVQVIKLNNINQPNPSVPTAQPMWHDELALRYASYTVVKTKVTALLSPSTGAQNLLWGTCVRDSTSNYTPLAMGWDQFCQNPNTTFAAMNAGLNGISRPARYSKTFLMKNIYGVTAPGNISTAFNSNPVEGAEWMIRMQPAGATATMGAVFMQLVITYDVLCTDPLKVAES